MHIRIAIEGADGTGKTSVANKLAEKFKESHPEYRLVYLREPGGTYLGEWARENIIFPKHRENYDHTTMRLGFIISHSDVVNTLRKIESESEKTIIILDRYSPYSNYVYERYGDQMDASWFRGVYRKLMEIWRPDHVFILDPDADMIPTVIERSKEKRANHNWMDDEADAKAYLRIEGYRQCKKMFELNNHIMSIKKETTIDEITDSIFNIVNNHYVKA